MSVSIIIGSIQVFVDFCFYPVYETNRRMCELLNPVAFACITLAKRQKSSIEVRPSRKLREDSEAIELFLFHFVLLRQQHLSWYYVIHRIVVYHAWHGPVREV